MAETGDEVAVRSTAATACRAVEAEGNSEETRLHGEVAEAVDFFSRLPDEIVLLCFSFIPRSFHMRAQGVCRAWRRTFRSRELYELRKARGVAEAWLYVNTLQSGGIWKAYNLANGTSFKLPPCPSPVVELYHHATVVFGPKLFVIGGASERILPKTGEFEDKKPTNQVWIYDAVSNLWNEGPPMNHARARFAYAVLGNYIMVAGGSDICGKALSSAEMLNLSTEEWEMLSDMPSARLNCFGLVVDGEFWVGVYASEAYKLRLHKWTIVVEDDKNISPAFPLVYGGTPLVAVEKKIYSFNGTAMYCNDFLEKAVWSSRTNEPMRFNSHLVVYKDRILVVGGHTLRSTLEDPVDMKIWSPGSREWSVSKKLHDMRGTVTGCALLAL